MTINCQQKNNSVTTIGGRIAYARKLKKMTQVALAEKLELTQGYIGHIEKGRNQPTLDQIMSMAIILDCNMTWLATGEGEMKPQPIIGAEKQEGYASPVAHLPMTPAEKRKIKLKAMIDRIVDGCDEKTIKVVESQLELLDPGNKKPNISNEQNERAGVAGRRVA